MKRSYFISTAVLLVAFLQRYDCRAAPSPGAAQSAAAPQPDAEPQSPPMLLRLGEEFFIRLGNQNYVAPKPKASADALSAMNRALQLTLRQRLLRGKVGSVGRFAVERERRSEEPPISLDLTFHLLREVLEMARAEQLAQQASSNRKMMDTFGK